MGSAKLWLALAGSGASMCAHAGLVITQSHTTESDRGGSSHSVMRMSVQGEHARNDVLEMSQDNPMMGVGSYVLMTAGKSEIILVKPAEKTYMRMDPRDMRGMSQMAGRAEQTQQQQGGGDFVTDLKVEKKVDEAGPTMLGMPTRHLLYAISYTQPMGLQNQPIKMQVDVKQTRELWVTHALDSKAGQLGTFGSFAEGMGQMTGSLAQLAEVDKRLRAEGFALKSVKTSESKTNVSGALALNPATMLMRGKGGSSRTVMEVTEVREDSLPAEHFALPKGYSERELMNPNAGEMPDLSKLPGRGGQPGKEPPPMPDLNNIPH